MQGGAATLARKLQGHLASDKHTPDVLLVTDMTNLPALLGLARHEVGHVPTVLYCHENQLTYPLQPGEKRDLTYPMINWVSMLAADSVVFNSQFHLEDWFTALPELLKRFPDCSQLPLIPEVRAKSMVVPVGCDLSGLDASRSRGMALPSHRRRLILWNQRWEYDKDPATFCKALDVLAAMGISFDLALAGANVQQQAEAFESIRSRFGDRVVHYGRADRVTYRELLWRSDVVVSTARQEFFGVAVTEAMYCRSFPVLPRRLAYPGLLPVRFHERCLYRDFDELVSRLAWALTHPEEALTVSEQLRSHVTQFDWTKVAPRLDAALEDAVVGVRS
jgi:hypothetical protein